MQPLSGRIATTLFVIIAMTLTGGTTERKQRGHVNGDRKRRQAT